MSQDATSLQRFLERVLSQYGTVVRDRCMREAAGKPVHEWYATLSRILHEECVGSMPPDVDELDFCSD